MSNKIEIERELVERAIQHIYRGPVGADQVIEKLRALLATPVVERQESVARESDKWSKDWKEQGFNYCIETAIKALKYLADYPRPNGGESRYNAEHLIMTAQELALTRQELLIGREQPAQEWPVLDKPAKVGAIRFGIGISTRTVIMAAQRQWEYAQQPMIEAERVERLGTFIHSLHESEPVAVVRDDLGHGNWVDVLRPAIDQCKPGEHLYRRPPKQSPKERTTEERVKAAQVMP